MKRIKIVIDKLLEAYWLGRIAVLRMSMPPYQPNSVVSQSVTLVSPVKMVELIEMLFGMRTRVGQGTTH